MDINEMLDKVDTETKNLMIKACIGVGFSTVEIASRPDLTSEQVERLSNDPDGDVRWTVACRKDLTSEQVERLSNDRHTNVRCAVACRTDLTKEQIQRLSNDPDDVVRWEIQQRK